MRLVAFRKRLIEKIEGRETANTHGDETKNNDCR